MQKHIGSPWCIRGNEIGKRIESDDQSDGMLALIATVDMYDFREEAEANKLLIASAPALLEALEEIYQMVQESYHVDDSNMETMDKVYAAIAAARGTV